MFARETEFWAFKIFGMVQIFVDLIFDLQSVIENKILLKITGYTVSVIIIVISVLDIGIKK